MKNFGQNQGSVLKFIIILFFLFFSLYGTNAQQFDLVLKGGHLIDPKNNIDEDMDVAIRDGKIAEVTKNIPEDKAKRVVDVSGLYVTPGLLDMHGHVFEGTEIDNYIANGFTSVKPDAFTFRAGVTTIVDAGSSGWRNFPLFKSQTIDKAKTRVLAFLNISGYGMNSRYEEQDLNEMNPEMTALMIKELYPDILVGIKAAHYWGEFQKVDSAVVAGKLAGVPVMVDFGEHQPPNSIESLFMEHLRPGDIFTHAYSYGPKNRETIVDEEGIVKPFVFKAQERGVIFDVGHGGGAFSWRQAVPASKQGFKANTISTDLHTDSMNAGMKDLSNVASKFLALDFSLFEVISRVTWAPAQVINRPNLGNLDVGSDADVAVFKLHKGNFGFIDVRNKRLSGEEKLEAQLTLRAGEVVWDLNGLMASDFK